MRTPIEIEKSDVRPTRPFTVYNTSHRPLVVLAIDRQTAQSIAWSAAHIYHSDNGLDGEHRQVHEGMATIQKLTQRQSMLLGRAANEGRQGTIAISNDRIFVGNSELA